jgi:hypothetical protein
MNSGFVWIGGRFPINRGPNFYKGASQSLQCWRLNCTVGGRGLWMDGDCVM